MGFRVTVWLSFRVWGVGVSFGLGSGCRACGLGFGFTILLVTVALSGLCTSGIPGVVLNCRDAPVALGVL